MCFVVLVLTSVVFGGTSAVAVLLLFLRRLATLLLLPLCLVCSVDASAAHLFAGNLLIRHCDPAFGRKLPSWSFAESGILLGLGLLHLLRVHAVLFLLFWPLLQFASLPWALGATPALGSAGIVSERLVGVPFIAAVPLMEVLADSERWE